MAADDKTPEANQFSIQEKDQYGNHQRRYETTLDDSASTISPSDGANGSPTRPLSRTASQVSKGQSDGEQMSRQISHVGSLYQNVTTMTSDPQFEVDWDGPNDTNDPKNWSVKYKAMCIAVLSWNTFITYVYPCIRCWVADLHISYVFFVILININFYTNSILYSTTYTAGETLMMADFHQPQVVVTLGLTLYLCGLGIGALFAAPLSEMFGRKPVAVISGFVATCLIIPCGLATSIQELIIVRFFGAIAASSMLACAPGSVSDLVTDEYRGLAMSFWAIGPNNGPGELSYYPSFCSVPPPCLRSMLIQPVFGPIIGGFVAETLGWKWNNWIVMILMGVGTLFSMGMSETYGPLILQKKAQRLRKETGDDRYYTRYDIKESPIQKLKVYLSRPMVMAVTEPIWYVMMSFSILIDVR